VECSKSARCEFTGQEQRDAGEQDRVFLSDEKPLGRALQGPGAKGAGGHEAIRGLWDHPLASVPLVRRRPLDPRRIASEGAAGRQSGQVGGNDRGQVAADERSRGLSIELGRRRSLPDYNKSSGGTVYSYVNGTYDSSRSSSKGVLWRRNRALTDNDLRLSKRLTLLLGLGDPDGEPQGCPKEAERVSRSMPANGLGLATMIKSRIKRFQTRSREPSAEESQRGVMIEPVYDFYTFEDKRLHTRRMDDSVFHHRAKPTEPTRLGAEAEADMNSESLSDSDDSDASSQESPRPCKVKFDVDSPSPRRAFCRRWSDPSCTAGEALASSTGAASSSSRGLAWKNRPRFTSNRNVEAVARWGELTGKLMHTRLLDFATAAAKLRYKTRLTGARTSGGLVLGSARGRARAVVKQAWQLAKLVNKETRDAFDSGWGKKGFLVELFSQEYVDTLALFARSASKICAVQPSLVEARAPCKIFGDIHGQFRDLLLIFRAFGSPDERDAPMFVFNGDFVDRGEHQLEVIGLLLAFKVLLPEKVWLVRGNHEFRFMNERYGFLDECNQRLGSFGPKLFELFHLAFDVMPVACLISDRILCVHGGIGEGNFKVDDIRGIRRPLNDDNTDAWVHNLLWSDPIEDDTDKSDVFGVHASPRGGAVSTFGWNVTKSFCARNGLGLIIRSHQSKRDSLGIDIMHDNLLMRVFTARDYEGHGNDGAVLLVKPASDAQPRGGVLLVRPQVLRSVAKGKRARAAQKARRRAEAQAAALAAGERSAVGGGGSGPDSDSESEDEDDGPAFESTRSLRRGVPG